MTTPTITITINNRIITVRPTATVLQACESAGVEVPRFCYHESLSVAGNCRRCLVEVAKSPKPVVSCARPVSPNIVVWTDTPLVRKAREAVREFLLLNHPLDCPICDQGGECDLQEEARAYGADRGRNYDRKRSVEDKECGPIVKTVRTRCIHCTRCIRFAAEVAGLEGLGSFGRGEETEIGPYVSSLLKTELSGNLVDLCPVGALTSKPYAYQSRPWELSRHETFDRIDALASEIVVQTRGSSVGSVGGEAILRVLPRQATGSVENAQRERWISDRTRFAFEGLRHGRLQRPFRTVSNNSSRRTRSWPDIRPSLAQRLITLDSQTKNSNPTILLGARINVEEIGATTLFAARRGWSAPIATSGQTSHSASRNVDSSAFLSINRSLNSIAKVSARLRRGTNLRAEASRLATTLRREQRRRGRLIGNVSSFTSQRLRQNHVGNSLRSIVAILENRLPITSALVRTTQPGLLLGVESLRSRAGSPFYAFAVRLAHRLQGASRTEVRRGIIHASVGSLASAVQGLAASPVNPITAIASTLISLHHRGLSSRRQRRLQKNNSRNTFVHRGTHTPLPQAGSVETLLLPVTSLYERTGHLISLEGVGGILRTHRNVVTSPNDARSIETLWGRLRRRGGSQIWSRWTDGIKTVFEELPRRGRLNAQLTPFPLNPFIIRGTQNNISCVATIIAPTRTDRYLVDPISAASPTRGECSLFLGTVGAFRRER